MSFEASLVAEIPRLRAQALRFTRDADAANDLVQDALLKALLSRDSYEPETNLGGWLFTILKNHFVSSRRGRRSKAVHLDVTDPALGEEQGLATRAMQEVPLLLHDAAAALDALPADTRAMLLQVSVEHRTYDEVAAVHGMPAGTIKSRVGRARSFVAIAVRDGLQAAHDARRLGDLAKKESWEG